MRFGDLASKLAAYENGELNDEQEVVDLFQDLVNSGLAWRLQGSYGRMASRLLQAGLISPADGSEVLRHA